MRATWKRSIPFFSFPLTVGVVGPVVSNSWHCGFSLMVDRVLEHHPFFPMSLSLRVFDHNKINKVENLPQHSFLRYGHDSGLI